MTPEEKTRFYSGVAWKRARAAALRRDRYLCQDCRGRGLCTAAEMVHHVKPFAEHPALALCLDNLVSLCNACHSKAHPEKLDGKRPHEQPKAANPLHKGVRIFTV